MCVVAAEGILTGLADSYAQAARRVRVLCQNLASYLGVRARAGYNRGPEGLHQYPAIGLLLIADLNHVDLALQPEELAGHRHGTAPLPCASLCGYALNSLFLVVVCLGDRSIKLGPAGGVSAS